MNPELVPYEALAKETMRRCLAEEEPSEINQWLAELVARLAGSTDDRAMMTWEESFEFSEMMLVEYERLANNPEEAAKMLTFPWSTWRDKVRFLDPGSLIAITAPDGQGKTIYGESLVEHWARTGSRVVFVHFELNRKLMMLRRLARHTSLTADFLKAGKFTAKETEIIREAQDNLKRWQGRISYLHTPGWSADKTVAELRRLNHEGLCDAVVWDYLEKTAASRRQLQMYGNNGNMREADNVEQIKNFAEAEEIPLAMITQMSKDGKQTAASEMDRNNIRGAGEKSDKSNVVIMIKRERIEDGYSNEVNVHFDKNTMGATGSFKQIMQPEYFRVADIHKPTM